MQDENKATPMEKLATFIVDKRNLFFLLYIFAIVFCIFSNGWVKVENDITTYLPDATETRQGLTIMNDEFVTYGTAKVMVSNISYEHGAAIKDEILEVEGVSDPCNLSAIRNRGSLLYQIIFFPCCFSRIFQ